LRTVCGSLKPLGGEIIWGFGCQVGVYAQHVYSSLPETKTVLEYLEYQAAPSTNNQHIKDVAGNLLFSGNMIDKRIRVLSGGERARLVLAGLLLQNHNVLVLDEPGNHLDVESVEALAEALCQYQGTVIFTSHDRHFMHRVATHVVEVRCGRVASYPGSYDEYVYRVQNEIDSGLRAPHTPAAALPTGPSSNDRKARAQADRDLQKKLKGVERKIARLDDEKRAVSEQLLSVTDAGDAQRLHARLTKLSSELLALEEEWFTLEAETA
ncbi:MAG: ATP-binding cassette domain-containing protein, partial [Planctomycetes bacterium]|nr:ATP-binding cassette domain-containing protein [Planctomycetota bacterium]